MKAGASSYGFTLFYFMPFEDLPEVPEKDVLSACEAHLGSVRALVYECYEIMGPTINDKWIFTTEHIANRGLSIEEAEEELGFPRGYTDIGRPDLIT